MADAVVMGVPFDLAEGQRGSPHIPYNESIVSRVANLPLVSSAYDMMAAAYSSTKENHPYVKSVCEVAEQGVRTVAGVTATTVKPLVDKLEPQISTANQYACKGLDKLEDKLPILQHSSEKLAANAKDIVASTVGATMGTVTDSITGAVDKTKGAVNNSMEMTRGVVSGGMDITKGVVLGGVEMTRGIVSGGMDITKGMVLGGVEMTKGVVNSSVDLTKGVVSGGVEMTKSVVSGGVSTVMNSRVGQLVTAGVDTALGKTEEYVDYYLPPADAPNHAGEAGDAAPERQLMAGQDPQSYYVRFHSLSAKVRQRLYVQSVDRLRKAKIRSQDTIAQLQHTVNLIEYAKTHLDTANQLVQDKLQSSWQQWKGTSPGEGEEEGAENESKSAESRTLAMARTLSQQVHKSCVSLATNVRGLPQNVQDQAQRVRQNADALVAAFRSTTSFKDIPAHLLTRSKEQISQLSISMEDVVDYLLNNTPFNWMTVNLDISDLQSENGDEDEEEVVMGNGSAVFVH
ncbi:perilipin-2-like isoform X1 [Petromyzon marinus]|uniref:Perilipin n=1 Tax=Petromyzon marinus TaxID=7757 RepID=A0AAJ7SQB7_PETMA|nr:perilipin-2-like isoform X1 [Petromyzon marinus]XP_032802709.1 perilipin-2-like isoform X1 [Petromyzon marinus]